MAQAAILQPTVLKLNESSSRLADRLTPDQFGAIFRQCAPYIAMHSGSVMVFHLPSFVVFGKQQQFDAVMDDLALLHLMGIRLIVVLGVTEAINDRLRENDMRAVYVNSTRITDEAAMRQLKELCGAARYEVESALARGFQGRPGSVGTNVISGNFFYSAQPLGVRNGVDFLKTGEVRRIDTDQLSQCLERGDVVLLTGLGYSTSGEVFNVNSETLASVCASRLGASKIVYLVSGDSGLKDTRTGTVINSLRVNEAVSLLDRWGIQRSQYIREGEVNFPTQYSRFPRVLASSANALLGGVKRAHIIAPRPGALLKELYTRDGSGLLISRDVYEGIRLAQPADLRAIEDLIRPLEQKGILKHRPSQELEGDLQNTYLLIRDGACLACGMLKKYSDSQAEIACLAVNPAYRRSGRGETMLSFLEREALRLGVSEVFVLSTQSMQWFLERGFQAVDPKMLPESRKYDPSRKSKVYQKMLGGQRDIDEEEILWDIFGR
eukprot:gnl/TRDRNA2_/TRDRNA2_148084_c1_seq1.p1 gnl/TRDRNA2_/TRDRNA2_148084_c1~~gnl/TRDRNA2_/TRDRNA2_148084_c1_seq1.p1  ORF type:complete len:564 (-),score=55.94 gnl/TRDRNA2_/TRDRNA2_148084_c1_seq1:53-1534(-)